VERLGGIAAAYELTSPAHRLDPVSYTFHGRDVFAPAAAYLVRGAEPSELGPALDPSTLTRLHLPEPELSRERVRASVLIVDRFGNIQLNLRREHLEHVGIEPGTRVELELALERYYAVTARTFADARPGDIILYEDSYGNVAVAISGGSAAGMLAVRPGEEIRIRVAE
jgi:S-adenosylmethionine hydrolase